MDKKTLDINDYANFFSVIEAGSKSRYNLCRSLSFDNVDSIDSDLYSEYVVMDGDTWTAISWKKYGTIKLWWLIAKFNQIKNPFDFPDAGTVLKIPGNELKEIILDNIKKQGNK